MKIAIDMTPLNDARLLSHRVRGTGFYLKNLKKALQEYYPEHSYTFFDRGEHVDKSVDLVHYPYFEPFFITLPLHERKKRVVTVHDLTPLIFPEHFSKGIKGNIKWHIQKQNLLNSERILTDSESSKKDISRFTGIPDSRIDVAYLAAGKEFRKLEIGTESEGRVRLRAEQNRGGDWKLKIQNKYRLPNKFVLYVGDATWNKNLPRLIKAAVKANTPLVMVGKTLTEENFDKSNPWNKDLAETQRLAKEHANIKLLGFVPTDDLVAIYNTAAALAMPSLYEGFGLPVLEAMQSGCPVITSQKGSLPEVAGDAALYVDPEDIDDMVRGIEEILKNLKLQTSLSQKGIIQAKRFSWQKTARETIEAYKKVLDAGN